MINTQILKLTKTKELIFSAIFTGLAVFVPMIFHFFGGINAGREFLPMHFFVLIAGLLFGWRAGLIVGIFSSLISFLLTGMPVINILPFILVELGIYGLVAGLFKERFNVWISLLSAMILGRVAILVAIFLFSNMNAVNYIFQAINNGWQGIMLQIIFVPMIVSIINSSLFQREVRRD